MERAVVTASERRADPRRPPPNADLATIRFQLGAEAGVIDYSPKSVAVVTAMRLHPGRRCVVCWPALHGRPALSATVVRTIVDEIHPVRGLRYRAALRFDEAADFLWERTTPDG
ncbi:MAG: hypothetical protein AB7I50_16280 [Vicinamibacterales bacterium]